MRWGAVVFAACACVEAVRGQEGKSEVHAHGEHVDHHHDHEKHNDHHGGDHHHHHHHHHHRHGDQDHHHHEHGKQHKHSHDHGDHHHHHHHGHEHGHGKQHRESAETCSESHGSSTKSPTNPNAWVEAFGGTLAITFGGNAVILFFVMHEISPRNLKVMLAFAAGALLGDVFLHLLPHAMESDHHDHAHHHHDHGHNHEHSHDLSLGLSILAGILVFFALEKALRLISANHHHGHSHAAPKGGTKKKQSDAAAKQNDTERHTIYGIKPAAILNMTGDALHNFTDGMSIAAAFQISRPMGMTVTLAMLLHEIPHEVGDYAVLLSQGFSRWGALKAQFVSAIGALLGCWFGLVASTTQPMFVLTFTAGGFIYISMCSILPELLEDSETGFADMVLQLMALLLGIYLMVLIAQNEPGH